MATDAGTAYLDVEARMDKLDHSLSTSLDKSKGKFSSFATGIGGALAGAFAGAALSGFVSAAGEAQKVAGQTEAGIRSTGGVANVTSGHIAGLADEIKRLSGFEDEAVQEGANLLLTFTNIRNEAGAGNNIFDQTTLALADVAARMGTDVPSAAVQLGKALNDPADGISALTRIGVRFTDEQKAQIETMVASGDVMGAQKVILKELNTEFGGSAKALGDARTPAEKLSQTFGDLQEKIGLRLLPVLNQAVDFFLKLPGPVQAGLVVFLGLGAAVAFLAPLVGALAAALPLLGAGLGLLFSPIGLLVAAVVGLGIVIWKNWDTIKEAFAQGVEFVSGLIGRLVGFVQDLPGRIAAGVGEIIGFIGSIPGRLVGFVGELLKAGAEFGKAILRGIVNGITGAVEFVVDIGKAIVNALINLVNDKVIGSINKALEISWDPPGPIGKISLNPPDIPKIPTFHTGGIVPGRRGEEVLAMLQAGELVTPLGGGGGTNQTFEITVNNPEPEPASVSLPRVMRKAAVEHATR